MTVLVGYTPSLEGEAAFEAGLSEAVRRGARLVVLNSPRQGSLVDPALVTDEQAATLGRRAEQAGVDLELQHTPHTDDLVDELLGTAAKVDAELLVIGLRRRTPLGKMMMGSNAQRILLRSDLPVLAVKPTRA